MSYIRSYLKIGLPWLKFMVKWSSFFLDSIRAHNPFLDTVTSKCLERGGVDFLRYLINSIMKLKCYQMFNVFENYNPREIPLLLIKENIRAKWDDNKTLLGLSEFYISNNHIEFCSQRPLQYNIFIDNSTKMSTSTWQILNLYENCYEYQLWLIFF